MAWVIAYDIENPKRWRKIYYRLNKMAFNIQLSVFYNDLSQKQINLLLKEFSRIIDPRKDDIRFYKIQDENKIRLGGRSFLPKGVKLSNRKILNHIIS